MKDENVRPSVPAPVARWRLHQEFTRLRLRLVFTRIASTAPKSPRVG